MAERVLVTGVGCISALGERIEDVVSALLDGRTAVREIERFDVHGCRSQRAALVTSFDPAQYLDVQKLRRIDDSGRLAIASTRLALEDAALDGGGLAHDAIGVVFGSYTAGTASTTSYLRNLVHHGAAGVSAMTFSNTVGNAAASLCGLEFGLRGPNVSLSTKEASGIAAASYAADLVRHGRADAVVAGGVDWIDEFFFHVHDRFPALAHADNGTLEASRPFDKRRNGFVFGEGAYAVVLEAESSVRARSATVLGEILGTGSTGSRVPINDWPHEPEQLVRAMNLALEAGGLSARDVSVVFASANSTPELDRVEAAAISEVFGVRGVPVVSLKGALGEFGGIGVAALMTALACIPGDVPPNTGLEQLDDLCPVDASSTPRTVRGSVAMMNAFASGGTNYVLLVRSGPSID